MLGKPILDPWILMALPDIHRNKTDGSSVKTPSTPTGLKLSDCPRHTQTRFKYV